MSKLRTLLLTCLGLAPLSAIAQTSMPIAGPSGTFDGSSYTIFLQNRISWADAKAFVEDEANLGLVCGATGGTPHLATLTRPAENAFVEGLLGNLDAGRRDVWIGLSQDPLPATPGGGNESLNWRWENSEGPAPGSASDPILGYRNWADAEGEPNDFRGREESEATIGRYDDGRWNDESSLGNVVGFLAECDFFDNNGVQLLTAVDGDDTRNITSVGTASTGVAATATETSCVICRPTSSTRNTLWHPNRSGAVNLRPVIANTPSCEALDAALPADDRIILLRGQRGFLDGNGNECFTASLVQLRGVNGEPVDAIDGPVLSEETPLNAEPVECEQAFVGDSPFGLSKAVGQSILTPDSLFCNRRRSVTRYSDRFQLFDARLDPNLVPIRLQVAQYASVFRARLRQYAAEGCVDPGFLDQVRRQYNRAVLRSQFSRRSWIENAIDRLQALAVFTLNISDVFDPYREADAIGNRDSSRPLCPGEAKGELSSQILSMSFLIWRGRLFPDTYENYADDLAQQTGLRCLIPPFPTAPLDTVPAACANPEDVLPPPYMPPSDPIL